MNRRRTAIQATALIVIICVVAWLSITLYHLIIQPRLAIHAPDGSTIYINQLSDGRKVAQQSVQHGSIIIKVDPGEYAITITSNNGQPEQLFYASGDLFQTKQLTFTASDKLETTTVARTIAFNAIPGDTAISYLNTSDRAIESIDEHGVTSLLASSSGATGTAQALYPLRSNQAIAVSDNRLYLIRNNQAIPLNMTGFPANYSVLAIGSNPAQDSFAVAADQAVYWYATPEATPRKLLSLDKQVDQLALGGTKLIAYSTRMPDARENIRNDYNNFAIDPVIIDINTKTDHVLTTGPIVEASLSPDGHYAIIEMQSTSHSTLYNLANGRSLYDIENPDIVQPFWADNTHFVYSKATDIWKLDVTSKIGAVIGSVPANQQPTSITFDTNAGQYYVATYTDEDSAAIYRLSETPVDPNAERAATLDTATQTSPFFSFTYVNISHPTVLVTTNVISNNPSADAFRTLSMQSRQAALDYLHQYNINTSKLSIEYNPSSF